MKKIKTLLAMILCVFSSIMLFACEKKPIKVETITISEENIVLRPAESKDITVTVKPDNAKNKNIRYILSDDSCVMLNIDEEDNYKATITAKDVIGPVTTYLQVVSEDNTIFSNTCKITVFTEKTQLFTPQNLKYDYVNQMIVWDNIDASSGYKLVVNFEGEKDREVICSTNSCKIDDFFNKVISVKVKSLGDDVIYSDSEYSVETFKFIQPEEPTNLQNDGQYIKFDRVENAESYNILVYDSSEKENPDYSYSVIDATFNPEVGYKLDLLENAGKTYIIKVQTIAKDFENVTKYPSLSRNNITISKFDTPVTSSLDFRFTYNSKTLSWKSIPNSTGYIVTRTGATQADYAEYTISDHSINYLILDTEEDKLSAGIYNYSIKILGNNKEFLDSNTSSSIQIEKLKAPNLYVGEGKIKWNAVENVGGYLFKIDDSQFTRLSSSTIDFTLGQTYRAKEYSFVIVSDGNGVDTLTSEPSEIFKAIKLASPNIPYLDTDCKTLKFSAVSFVDTLKIFVTHNESQVVYNESRNDLTYNDVDKTKNVSVDMSLENFDSGDYKTYAVAFSEGYLTSEPSITYSFKKLPNTNTAKIQDGKLSYSLIENAKLAEVYINGSLVNNFDADTYQFIEGEEYKLRLRYIPNANSNYVISNASSEFSVTKLASPNKLYVENGEIKYSTSSLYGIKFYVTSGIETNIYNSLDKIILNENVIYTIKMCHVGENAFLNSGFSNIINVKLTDSIDDFKLVDDTLSFTDINASSYKVCVDFNEPTERGTKTKDLTSNSFSLKELITSEDMFFDNYNSLHEILTLYISSTGGTLNEPVGNENIIVNLDRAKYGKNLNNNSNKIFIRILSSPTNLRATKVMDLLSDSSLEINELYFDLEGSASLFEFTYVKNNKTISKILTTNNYLSKIDNDTYKIDTSFLEAGIYDFSIKSVSATKTETSPYLQDVIYNINSFDIASLSGLEKLTQVTSLSCVNGNIIINDDSNYIFVLTINGKIIFDDVLEEGQDINYLINLATTDVSKALQLIAKFKEKTRTLPSSYTGTFNVNAIKYSVPTSLIELAVDKPKIKSDLTNPITITRLNTPRIVMKNGVVEWNAIENAESYEVFVNKQTSNDYELLTSVTKNKGEELKVDLNELLNQTEGNYQVYVVSKTTKANYLSSGASSIINFEILEAPTLNTENGVLKWNSIQNAAGYSLQVYNENNVLITSFEYLPTILSYDVMKTNEDKIINSGSYKFVIKALGQLNNIEESTVITSKESTFNATKLNTPLNISIKNGKIVLSSVNNNVGVDNYLVYINDVIKNLTFSSEQYLYELPEEFESGEYILSYQAIAKGNYLTSNITNEFNAYKLNTTKEIYVDNGEIYWHNVTVENYKNSRNEDVVYNLNIKAGDSIKSEDRTLTSYIMSEDDDVPSGLYTLNVKTIGDDYYYLNSNVKTLENVVKLDYIKDFKISEGKLVWTSPSVINGTANFTKSSPNGLNITFVKDGEEKSYKLENLQSEFVLDERFSAGSYNVTIQNIGNVSGKLEEYYFINSKIVSFGKNILKLNALTNLNIKDGINLTWNDSNIYTTNKFILSITQNLDNTKIKYNGIIKTSSSSIPFENIAYYVNDNDENILILKTDENVTLYNDIYYYNNYKVLNLDYKGSFDVNITAFGDNQFINSNTSNTINIVLPEKVKNLKVEHGKITWDINSSANGYIVTLTRMDIDGNIDVEYGKFNELIYLTTNTYNLTDVNYIYTISVRAYSLINNDNNQSMASLPVIIEDYSFISFRDGNGTDEKPYIISNEEELGLIKYNNFATYKLEADIVMSKNFEPIFNENEPFVGKLIGYKDKNSNYTIRNLNIINLKMYSGLLGYISTTTIIDDRAILQNVEDSYVYVRTQTEKQYVGTVENIDFANVNVTAGIYVGTIAGYSNGIIKNITINGNVNSNTETSVDVGASINSVYSGSVVALNYGIITNIKNDAMVGPTANTSLYSGGLVSQNFGIIYNCENNGVVKGTIAGGISAINSGVISAVINTANVICNSYSSNVTQISAVAGGIAAQNKESGQISNSIVNNSQFDAQNSGVICASTENILSKVVYLGGLVGENYGNCFNNIVRTKVYVIDSSINCGSGKLIGYNENNGIKYNYCLNGSLSSAQVIIANNAVYIDSTNREVIDLNTSIIVNELNANNIVNNITDITWEIVNNNITFIAEERV